MRLSGTAKHPTPSRTGAVYIRLEKLSWASHSVLVNTYNVLCINEKQTTPWLFWGGSRE